MQSGRRPAVVLHSSATLLKIPTVIVVPGTSKLAAARYPHTVRVSPRATNGLPRETIFLAFQLQSVDPSWIESPRVGALTTSELEEVENAVLDALGFDPPDEQAAATPPPAN